MHQSLEELCPASKDNHVKSLFRKVALLEAEARLDGTDPFARGGAAAAAGQVRERSTTVMEETEPEITGGIDRNQRKGRHEDCRQDRRN